MSRKRVGTNLKNYKEWKSEVLFLIGSMLFVLISSIVSYFSGWTWFARSGSIMVLSAVIVEYRLFKLYMEEISSSIFIVSMKKPSPIFISDEQNNISIVAHIFVVCGTLIWGYGDLLKLGGN